MVCDWEHTKGFHVSQLGLMLSDDLIFFSRVAGTARAKGVTVRQVKSAAELVAAVRQSPPSGVLIDLQNPGLELPSLLGELRSICPAMPHVVAYGSHVEREILRGAREAGCDLVMPRSQFVKELEDKLAGWLGENPSQN
jgi:CheY-like chemotaxis protein